MYFTEMPTRQYDVIYADPPWRYDFSRSKSREIENHYPTMTVSDICSLAVPSQADSILFLWGTNPKLLESLQVMQSWGYHYVTNMVWVKDRIGMGYYARSRHEFLLIGKKGKPAVPEPTNRPDSVIEAIRGTHSTKPEKVYELIERMYPNRTKLELFARHTRAGWDAWGNDPR